ncbi:uncharacterized protein [Clytia hemisphaerica]
MNRVETATCENFTTHGNTFLTLMRIQSSYFKISKFKSVRDNTEGKIAMFDVEFSNLNLKNSMFTLNSIALGSQIMNSKGSSIYFTKVDIVLPKSLSVELKVWKMFGKHRGQIKNFSTICGNHFNPQIKRLKSSTEIVCNRCPSAQYSMSIGSFLINSLESVSKLASKTNATKLSKIAQIEKATCKICPTGSRCPDNDLIARDNFHGFYENKTADYQFLLCPERYCCSSTTRNCKSPTTCNLNRDGRLCGKCEEGYFISFFNNKCINISECTNESQHSFWTLFFISFITLAVLLTFLKDLITAIKCAGPIIMVCLRKTCTKKREDANEIDEMEELQAGDNRRKRKEISTSSIFNILVSFFQLKALITVQSNEKTLIDKLMNMDIMVKSSEALNALCPFRGFNVVWREVLNGYTIPFLLLMTIANLHLIVKLLKHFRPSSLRLTWLITRFCVGYYIIIAFCYKNICRTVFQLLNCKTMNGVTFLYIDGTVECFSLWQVANMLFLVFWVVPFPFAVVLGYYLFKNKKISVTTYLIFFIFPMFCILRTCFSRWKGTVETDRSDFIGNRFTEIFEEPYRDKFFWWESWRLIERFIVSGIAVFLTNPIYRILYLTPVFASLSYFHFRMNPYKRSMYILKRLDMVSWFCLFVLLFINGMRAVVYIYDVPNIDFISHALEAANILENLFSPLWYLIISFIFKKLCEKLLNL